MMKLNGTVLAALRLVQMVKSLLMVSAFVHKANSSKKENVLTTQCARTEPNGMVSNVLESHATLEQHSAQVVAAVKLQSIPAPPEPTGTVIDAFM